jgi:hypothetical protein
MKARDLNIDPLTFQSDLVRCLLILLLIKLIKESCSPNNDTKYGFDDCTQFYFRTTQKRKRYLNLSFKYLVLFRRRDVSLVPFGAILTLPPPPWEFATAISAEEGKSGSLRASETHRKL